MPAQSLGTSSKTLAHWLLGLEPELSWKLEMQNRFFYYLFTYFLPCILVGAVAADCDWITVRPPECHSERQFPRWPPGGALEG